MQRPRRLRSVLGGTTQGCTGSLLRPVQALVVHACSDRRSLEPILRLDLTIWPVILDDVYTGANGADACIVRARYEPRERGIATRTKQ